LDYGPNPKTIVSAEIEVDVTGELQIIVPSGPLKTGQEITFTARTDTIDVLPDAPAYEWYFGDGEGLVIPFSNEATYLYDRPGKYTVTVQLFENEYEAANLLGVASVEVNIEAGDVDVMQYLQQTTHLLVSVRGDSTYYQSDGYSRDANGVPLIIYSPLATTTWEERHFSASYFSPPTGTSSGITISIEGDVSAEWDKILNLSARCVYDDAHRLVGEKRETKITVSNVKLESKSRLPVPFDPNFKVTYLAYIEGSEVADYVSSTFFEHVQPKTVDPNFRMWYDPLTFVNTEFVPYLLVVFKTERIDAYDDPGYMKRDN